MTYDIAEKSRRAFNDIFAERQRQHSKWGVQRHGFPYYVAVLGEEVGEVHKAVVEMGMATANVQDLRTELVHTAAVAVAIIEQIDEAYGGD